MNTESDKTSALVRRSPSAVEKAEPGAKHVLALMVAETLAIAQKQLTIVSTTATQAELEDWYQQGERHYWGDGVPQDYIEAAKWFRMAAEQGNAWAQDYIGVRYQDGDDLPQDSIQARKWN